MLFPVVLGGVSIIASIIGTFAVRTSTGNVERALYQGLIASGLLAALAFLPDHQVDDGRLSTRAARRHASVGRHLPVHADRPGRDRGAVRHHRLLHVDAVLRRSIDRARLGQTGHATNIIQGLAQGMQATALPALVIVLGIAGAHGLAGVYGIGVAVMAQLSLTGLIVALDAFGPITDNAGGIAEMADMPEDVRNVTDPLDAVGNTTKAVTKGYAIGSAAPRRAWCCSRPSRSSSSTSSTSRTWRST